MRVGEILLKITSLKKSEIIMLVYSVLFVLFVFASYAILRPIRDALGIHGDDNVLKWLFLGTFVATLVGSCAAMFLSGNMKRKYYVDVIYMFFSLNLIAFYAAMMILDDKSVGFVYLSRIFYVWVSVFNLFVISSAWSLLADIFSKEQSKQLFGIIAAGASLGSILGASGVSFLSKHIVFHNFIFVSLLLIVSALFVKYLLIKESYKMLREYEKDDFRARFNTTIGSKNPFSGIAIIAKSPYLLVFVCFILLLTSVSTFLYMEQARIVRVLFPTKEARAAAFANIDLIVQISSFTIQIFFTAKIAQYLGIKWLLSLLGFIVGVGCIVLSFTHPAFLPLVIVMSVRRVGEYALVKPGREMLFVPLDSDTKYKVKNVLDTVVYRGGDALSSQVESVLANISVSVALLSASFISFVWGALGLFLAKDYDKKQT